MSTQRPLTWIRILLVFFAVALIVSGVTAIPVRQELRLLRPLFDTGSLLDRLWPSMGRWLSLVYQGVEETYRNYPFLPYGYDWLAFGHFAIAIAFFLGARDPLRNRWVIDFGIVACILVVPYALVFGAIRHIPLFWRVIDSLFGVCGLIPLLLARSHLNRVVRPCDGDGRTA
jgi:hypothetical protein